MGKLVKLLALLTVACLSMESFWWAPWGVVFALFGIVWLTAVWRSLE